MISKVNDYLKFKPGKMIKVNEYFDGNVKSLAFEDKNGPATIGVMKPGEYEFGTSTVEFMTVTSGSLDVLLPGETEWENYRPFQTFRIDRNVKFRVKVSSDTSYLCHYE